jgi:hypothetical protein
MNEKVETATKSVFDALTLEGLADTATVVLIGSSARDTMNGRSDIDILVLDNVERRIRLKLPGDVHLQQYSRSKFLSRLGEGDDYPGWALRFGVPMSDPDGWWAKHVASELNNPHWPDWRPKVSHAKKRMKMASKLLEVGDVDAASEELMFAASHVARAVLLKHGVFPLSRPELPSQLEDFEPSLAYLLELLIRSDVAIADLKSGVSLLVRKIEQLQQAA